MKHTLFFTLGLSILLVTAGCTQSTNQSPTEVTQLDSDMPTMEELENSESMPPHEPIVPDGRSVIEGDYADVDVIQTGDSEWRMYYGIEPEVEGNQLEIYTAISTDGETWEHNSDAVLTLATFPDALVLEDGRIRLYYQGFAGIRSAISDDGVTFTEEDGLRVENPSEVDMTNVGASSTVQLDDGSYVMAYRVAEPTVYSDTSLNPSTTDLRVAFSEDGLTFTDEQVIVDGRSEIFEGYIDGSELLVLDDELLHHRFWTSAGQENQEDAGQYDMTSSDGGVTWSEPELFYASQDTGLIGGDPSYIIMNGEVHMFYANRTGAIYDVVLE